MNAPDVKSPADVRRDLAVLLSPRRNFPSPEERRALRKRGGISAAQLASVLGVSRQAVAQWERGVRMPSGPVFDAYAAALEMLADLDRDSAT